MLATVMNALALQNALEKAGVDTRVQSAIPMASVSEPYIRRARSPAHRKGRIVLFAAGTGNPYFTTDTAAALRAAEMGCDALFKGTSVDGVYTLIPKQIRLRSATTASATTRFSATTSRSWTPPRWLCAATTISRSSSQRPQPAPRAVLAGRVTATIVQERGVSMARHDKRLSAACTAPSRPEAIYRRFAPARVDGAARSDQCRGLWRPNADQPGGDGLGPEPRLLSSGWDRRTSVPSRRHSVAGSGLNRSPTAK
jgi:hypothetical protein